MYWEQGWENAPDLVKHCKNSWQYHNPEWDVRLLDKHTILEYFDIWQWMPGEDLKPRFLAPLRRWMYKKFHTGELIKTKELRVQNRSDIIRINLLEKHGGVWADATLFCRKPLSEWITPHLTQEFFAFSNPGKPLALRDGSLPLFLNYFLVASSYNYIIATLNQKMYMYWTQHNKMDQYLWMFALFNECYATDKKFADMWNTMEKIDAPIPDIGEFDTTGGVEFFAWQTPEQLGELSTQYKEMLATSNAPMFKLSNKEIYSPIKSSRISYLFQTLTTTSVQHYE